MRFGYKWRDDSSNWFRSYGNENWEFDEHGLMRRRIASINDMPIAESEPNIAGRLDVVPTITQSLAHSACDALTRPRALR